MLISRIVEDDEAEDSTKRISSMSSAFQLEKVEVALTPQERFQEFLQSRGRRMTQQRRQIVDEVFSRHEHFNADELCDHLSRSPGSSVNSAVS